jgi:hypothetical protein
LTVPRSAGANAGLKVMSLVAGMVARADSIDDVDGLRHKAMDRMFGGVRAPSTLGTFLRAFTFGHARQLDAAASRTLIGLSAAAPPGVESSRRSIVSGRRQSLGRCRPPGCCLRGEQRRRYGSQRESLEVAPSPLADDPEGTQPGGFVALPAKACRQVCCRELRPNRASSEWVSLAPRCVAQRRQRSFE